MRRVANRGDEVPARGRPSGRDGSPDATATLADVQDDVFSLVMTFALVTHTLFDISLACRRWSAASARLKAGRGKPFRSMPSQ